MGLEASRNRQGRKQSLLETVSAAAIELDIRKWLGLTQQWKSFGVTTAKDRQ